MAELSTRDAALLEALHLPAVAVAAVQTAITTSAATALTIAVPAAIGLVTITATVYLDNTAAGANYRQAIVSLQDPDAAAITLKGAYALFETDTGSVAFGPNAFAFAGILSGSSVTLPYPTVGASTTVVALTLVFVPTRAGNHLLRIQGTDTGVPTGTFQINATASWVH